LGDVRADESMLTGVRLVGAADKARLRGVVPGELGLGWGTGGCKRCGLGGEAEAGEQAAGEVGIGDEGHDGAATAAGALENVLGEHPAQELGPWQPARARHGGRATRVRRVGGGGRCGRGAAWVSGVVGGGGGHERAELRASFAGGAEHAGVANQMESGRRDDADKSSEKRDGLRDEVGAAVGPWALDGDISLMAITETGPSRSPKPDHRDHGERWTV